MAYIKITNGTAESYTIGELRRDNKNVSFPRIISNPVLADYGVYQTTTLTRPNIDNATQVVTVNEQPTQVDKQWTYGWTVRNKTAEELATQEVEDALNVRVERDELLTASDWTQVADSPVDQAAWATYRQALRDIPAQDGFPNTVTWPVAP